MILSPGMIQRPEKQVIHHLNFGLTYLLIKWLLKVIRLAHFSVKEYLVSSRILDSPAAGFGFDKRLADEAIAKICIGYLLHFKSLNALSHKTLPHFPLAMYAAKFWFMHARAVKDPSRTLDDMTNHLLQPMSTPYTNWIRLHQPDEYFSETDFSLTPETIPSPLYYASFCALEKTCIHQLQSGVDVNIRGGLYVYPLQAASWDGEYSIVKLLLESGADVDAQGGVVGTAIRAASWRGKYSTVKLLLESKADVNAHDASGRTALQKAAEVGHVSIVQLLLEGGADINAQDKTHGPALQVASYSGQYSIVKILLESGADVNARGGQFHSTALQAASREGHDSIVKLLLTSGADANASGATYGNALQVASMNGYDLIVDLLLKSGAHVNTPPGPYGSAVDAASREGHDSTVRILLDHGATYEYD